MRIFLYVIGLLLMTNMSMADDQTAQKIYNANMITLPNGMQVVVVENPRTPAVTHMVWYRVGGADEVAGHSGLAHYLEHLMFKGSDLVPPGEFSKKVKSWGGNDNAFTSWDFTAYFQTVPKDKLEAVMRMEADRMTNLNFDDADALTERDVVIQERKQRTDSNPSAQLGEAMRAALFVNHPYARPIIGWDHEIEGLTPQAAREFYKQYYAPRNAILVVSGDVNTKDVYEKAALIYGSIDNGDAVARQSWARVPDIYGNVTVTHDHSSIQQPIWRKLYRAPGAGQDYKKSLAFVLAENMIGGNTGRLYKSLVIDQQLASSVHFHYGAVSVEDSTVSIGVTPREGITMDQINDAINDVLTSAIDTPFTDDEIQKAINQIRDEAVYEMDSLTGPAMMLGYQLVSGVPLDQAETWIHDLNQISSSDISDIIQTYLVPSSENYHAVTGHLLPQEK
jgi:zinc protease